MLLNAPVFLILVGQFLHSYALIFVAGLLSLTAGLAIVLSHNVWVGDWRVLITIFGWLGVIGGMVRIILPQKVATIGLGLIDPWRLRRWSAASSCWWLAACWPISAMPSVLRQNPRAGPGANGVRP